MNDEYALDVKRNWLFEKAWERKQEAIRDHVSYMQMSAPRSKRSDLLDALTMAAYLNQELVVIDPKRSHEPNEFTIEPEETDE